MDMVPPPQGGRRMLVRRRAVVQAGLLVVSGVLAACGSDSGVRKRADNSLPPPPDGGLIPADARPDPTSSGIAAGPPVCLVTRQQGVSAGYTPPDLVPLPARVSASNGLRLRREAADALLRLVAAAASDGFPLFALSAYRSFAEQERILRDEIAAFGREVAERQVAQPGHSEHQLGLAADMTGARTPYDLRAAWGAEPDGQWLAKNAPRFGYVISYPRDKESVTGYIYEPWHIRHVGLLAESVAASGLTLSEYLPKFNLTGPCP